MLVRGPNGSYEDIDFRETMPEAGFQDMYNNKTNASIHGGLAAYGLPFPIECPANVSQWCTW